MSFKPLSQLLNDPEGIHFFILDIDSTLVTTHQRNQVILDAFVEEFKEKYPTDCEIFSKVVCELGDYGLQSGLARVNYTEQEPGCQKKLDDYWRKHFFSNIFLHADRPVPGAVEFVRRLIEKKFPYVYLTARHHVSMYPGTLSSLDYLGLPVPSGCLYMKEDLSMSDDEFKSKKIQWIVNESPHKDWFDNPGHKGWLIDNEPVVLNTIKNDHPDINLIWMDSTHSGRMQPPADIEAIKDFQFES